MKIFYLWLEPDLDFLRFPKYETGWGVRYPGHQTLVIKIKEESQTHMIFTVRFLVYLANQYFYIDQQSLACSQRGYSVYLAGFMGYVQTQ